MQYTGKILKALSAPIFPKLENTTISFNSKRAVGVMILW